MDLLAESDADAVAPAADEIVVDEDGLRLLVPPMAGLLARACHDVVLESVDAADRRVAVRLLLAFGAGGLSQDLREAQVPERDCLLLLLGQLGASALTAQARVSGYVAEPGRVEAALDSHVVSLKAQATEERASQ